MLFLQAAQDGMVRLDGVQIALRAHMQVKGILVGDTSICHGESTTMEMARDGCN